MRAALIVLFALVLAGCGQSVEGAPAAPTTTTPVTFTMTGTVDVSLEFTQLVTNTTCKSRGMTTSVSAGTPVTVRDERGTTVGTTYLRDGQIQTGGWCRFDFSPTVQDGANFYAVQVGSADPLTVDAAGARQPVALRFER